MFETSKNGDKMCRLEPDRINMGGHFVLVNLITESFTNDIEPFGKITYLHYCRHTLYLVDFIYRYFGHFG